MKYIKLIIFSVAAFVMMNSNLTAQSQLIDQISDQLSTWKPVKIEQIKQVLEDRFRQVESNKPEIYFDSFLYNNVSEIYQTGTDNTANINQFGYNNQSKLMQSGNNNSYTLDQSGSDIQALTEQSGDGNSIMQMLSGSGLSYTLMQQGNNNQIIQVETGQSVTEYQVTQSGANMKIYIVNGAAPW